MSDGVIIAFLTGTLSPLVIMIVKHYLEKKKSKIDPVADAVAYSNIICDELEELIQTHGADRAWIAQFHNGGTYYPNGRSIQKFSIFYEVSKYTRDAMKLIFQNIPVNLFSKFLGELLREGYIAIPDYRNEEVATYGLKYIADEYGAKSSYLFSIKTVENRLIGILAVEYTSRKKTLSPADIVTLRVTAAGLGGSLANKK
jgi:hypothetical protein